MVNKPFHRMRGRKNEWKKKNERHIEKKRGRKKLTRFADHKIEIYVYFCKVLALMFCASSEMITTFSLQRFHFLSRNSFKICQWHGNPHNKWEINKNLLKHLPPLSNGSCHSYFSRIQCFTGLYSQSDVFFIVSYNTYNNAYPNTKLCKNYTEVRNKTV